jgi:cell division protein FtsB
MKRIAVCAWAGFIAYAVCLFSIGPAGFKSMNRLETERVRLESNLKELKTINEGLALRVQALQSDRETITVEGRRYGYIAAGERLVRLVGMRTTQRYHVAGKILKLKEAPTQGGFIPLCAAITVAIAIFLLSMAIQPRDEVLD